MGVGETVFEHRARRRRRGDEVRGGSRLGSARHRRTWREDGAGMAVAEDPLRSREVAFHWEAVKVNQIPVEGRHKDR